MLPLQTGPLRAGRYTAVVRVTDDRRNRSGRPDGAFGRRPMTALTWRQVFAPLRAVSRAPLPGSAAFLALAVLATACGSDSAVAPAPAPPAPAPAPPAMPTPEPEPECPDSASYAVTFRAVWDASSHGSRPPFPSGAHFSRVVAAAHSPEVAFWDSGGIATPGIESMAETGSVSPLCREIGDEADRGRSTPCVRGSEASFPSPGSARLLFEATEELPLMTLVSMIAPSPDWFVGVSRMPLVEDGCWKERIEVDLVGYDSGTDSGATFTARNADVTPHEPIGLIRDLPAAVREAPFAVLELVLREESG